MYWLRWSSRSRVFNLIVIQGLISKSGARRLNNGACSFPTAALYQGNALSSYASSKPATWRTCILSVSMGSLIALESYHPVYSPSLACLQLTLFQLIIQALPQIGFPNHSIERPSVTLILVPTSTTSSFKIIISKWKNIILPLVGVLPEKRGGFQLKLVFWEVQVRGPWWSDVGKADSQ